MPSSLPSYAASHPDFADPGSSSSPLPARYSDLAPQRASNPASFRAAVAWWADLLAASNWHEAKRSVEADDKGKQKQTTPSTDAIVLRVDEAMLHRWTLEDVGRPLGIGTAVVELSRTSALTPLRTFLSSPQPLAGPLSSSPSLSARLSRLTVGGVAKTLLGTPIVWAASQIGIGGGGDSDGALEGERDWKSACRERDWVIWSNLERISTAILDAHFSSPKLSPLDSLFSRETFRRDILQSLIQSGSIPPLSDTDLKVVLRHLARDKGVAQVEGDVIKLARSEDEKVGPVREEEKGIVAIRTTHARLEGQVSEIEKRIVDCNTKISTSLQAKQKNVALSYLKSRKALEELLDRRAGALSTLQSTLLKIEQAAGDAEVVSAYETSASTLRTLLSDPRLKIDRVEGTMERLGDALADQREIEDAVMQGNRDVAVASGNEMDEGDEAELEREMQKLRIEVEGEEKEKMESVEQERKRKEEEEEEAQREKEQTSVGPAETQPTQAHQQAGQPTPSSPKAAAVEAGLNKEERQPVAAE